MNALPQPENHHSGAAPAVILVAKWRRIGGVALSLLMATLLGAFPLIFLLLPDASGATLSKTALSQFNDGLRIFTYLFLIGSGLFLLLNALRNVWWGDRLVLDHVGVRYKLHKRTGLLRWQDIKAFRLEAPLLGMAEVVGWDYHEAQSLNPTLWKRLRTSANHPTSLHGDLGYRWQGGAKATCETLENWRLHFAQSAQAAPTPDIPIDPATHTIQSAWWKNTLPLIPVCGGLFLIVGIPAYLVSISALTNLKSWILLLFPTLVTLPLFSYLFWLYTRRLLTNPRIVLSTSGFDIQDEQGSLFTRWREVEVFGLIYDTRSHRHYVGWRYKDRPANSHYSAEMDKIVGMGFTPSPETLRDTLEDWRIRFSHES